MWTSLLVLILGETHLGEISWLSPLHESRACPMPGFTHSNSTSTEGKSELFAVAFDKGDLVLEVSLGKHQMPKKKSLIKTKPFVH